MFIAKRRKNVYWRVAVIRINKENTWKRNINLLKSAECPENRRKKLDGTTKNSKKMKMKRRKRKIRDVKMRKQIGFNGQTARQHP